jgi:Arc/MetJ-type ribon-helix-helix transcriptional regulator
MQITIDLPDHLLAHIQAQVTSGHYATPSDYIQALIEADQARTVSLETTEDEEAYDTPIEDIREDLYIGWQKALAGRTKPISQLWDSMDLEDSIESHLLESLESPATPMTQADWDHICHTVRQNLPN